MRTIHLIVIGFDLILVADENQLSKEDLIFFNWQKMANTESLQIFSDDSIMEKL